MKTNICAILLFVISSVLADAAEPLSNYISSPDFLPGCDELLQEHSALIRGGGILISKEEDGSWLALGVGTAPLIIENGKKQTEENAWRAANDDALAALSEALWGIRFSAQESVELKNDQVGANSRVKERFKSMSVIERSGTLAGSWEVGRWKFGRNNSEVGVLRIVASPGHPIGNTAGRIPVISETLDPAWQEIVLSRPALRYGGVVAVKHQDDTWLLVAGVKHMKKNISSISPEEVMVVEENANVEWLRFVEGTQIQDKTQAKLEMIRINMGDDPLWESIKETLSTSVNAKEHGQTRLIPVGMWLADAGDTYRLAAVYRWTQSDGVRDPGFSMSRPNLRPLGNHNLQKNDSIDRIGEK